MQFIHYCCWFNQMIMCGLMQELFTEFFCYDFCVCVCVWIHFHFHFHFFGYSYIIIIMIISNFFSWWWYFTFTNIVMMKQSKKNKNGKRKNLENFILQSSLFWIMQINFMKFSVCVYVVDDDCIFFSFFFCWKIMTKKKIFNFHLKKNSAVHSTLG